MVWATTAFIVITSAYRLTSTQHAASWNAKRWHLVGALHGLNKFKFLVGIRDVDCVREAGRDVDQLKWLPAVADPGGRQTICVEEPGPLRQ